MHHHHPVAPHPPPRYESYTVNGSYRHNFDKLSNRSVNSLNDGNDERQTYSNMYFYEENNSDGDKDDRNRNLNQGDFFLIFRNLNDKIIKYRFAGFQIYSPSTTPPEPAPPDHLLTPSSILRQLKENAVSQSQSSLEEINCE
jgi:hypothetical protein